MLTSCFEPAVVESPVGPSGAPLQGCLDRSLAVQEQQPLLQVAVSTCRLQDTGSLQQLLSPAAAGRKWLWTAGRVPVGELYAQKQMAADPLCRL